MTVPGLRPVLRAGWPDALKRGFLAFVVMAGLGQVLALGVWALAGTGRSFGAFARIGWLYVGAFHHVALELEGPVAIGASRAEAGRFSVGVAFLAATGLALWLLFRAARAVADRAGGGTAGRILHGAMVAPAYAVPPFALALLVTARVHVDSALLVADLRASLDPWQALTFPFALAALAGAAGGFRSALDARPSELRLAGAAWEGGWRMFGLGLALAYGGLFVAGVVQPDEPVALLTPSSARYHQEAFARPKVGALILAHHVGLAPNEAVWTLVPAMGGCDAFRGGERIDFLCYRRFPRGIRLLPPGTFPLVDLGNIGFGSAPAGYLSFLVVPAAASALGGRLAAARVGTKGREALLAGALAGAVFAALVSLAAILSVVTVRSEVTGRLVGTVLLGPDLVTGPLLALAWGVLGGAAGAASSGATAWWRRSGSRPR